MAKTLFKISRLLLLVLLALHVLAAVIWGNWDQEGTGSLGFLLVFSSAVAHYAWGYGLLIVATVVFWFLSSKSTTKRNGRRGQSAPGNVSEPRP